MKRALLTAILGIAASAVNTHGEGFVIFSTYAGSVYSPVRYSGGPLNGQIASTGFSAELFYGLGSGLSLSSLTGIPSSIIPLNTTSAPGYVTGGIVSVPDYVSGPITFAVVAFNGTQWDPTFTGQFGSTLETAPLDVRPWTEASIAPPGIPVDVFQQNVPLVVISVPEPSTLALVGLAGVACLTSRRRQ